MGPADVVTSCFCAREALRQRTWTLSQEDVPTASPRNRTVFPRSGGLPQLLLPLLEFWHADAYRAHHAGKSLAGGRVLVMRFGLTKAECRAHGRLGLPLQATKSQWQLTMPDV